MLRAIKKALHAVRIVKQVGHLQVLQLLKRLERRFFKFCRALEIIRDRAYVAAGEIHVECKENLFIQTLLVDRS